MADRENLNEKTYCPQCQTQTSNVGDATCELCFTEKELYKAKFKKLCSEMRQLRNKLNKIQETLPPHAGKTELGMALHNLEELQEILYQEYSGKEFSYRRKLLKEVPTSLDKFIKIMYDTR